MILYSVAFSLSNTRVYFSIFVFSILVKIRVVHLSKLVNIYFSVNKFTIKKYRFVTKSLVWLK